MTARNRTWSNWVGRSNKDIDHDHQTWADQQPTLTLCAHCRWTFEGTAVEGRTLAYQHRAETHPELNGRRRPRHNLIAMSPRPPRSREADENRAEAMLQVEKRLRQIGAA